MTPRALNLGTGLPGPGQTIFPEDAKESGRNVALTDDIQILENKAVSDEGGEYTDEWVPKGATVKGRVEPVSSSTAGRGLEGGILDEASTHVATLEPDADVDTSDRLRIDEQDFVILAERIRTDRLTRRLEVRVV